MNISEVDKNFKVASTIGDADFYNICEKPFKIYGLIREDNRFKRMPKAVAEQVSEGVLYLSTNTSGGRIKFRTDSSFVGIRVNLGDVTFMPHMTMVGSSGFDLYVREEGEEDFFIRSFIPSADYKTICTENGYETMNRIGERKMRDITIHFPLYNNVIDVYIALEKGSALEEPTPYKTEKPIVFYGSSITQGACASRPGNSYTNILSRRLDVNHINLGFSGNAKCEDEIIDYINTLDMSAFVYDYDHNAPTLEHLIKTHERGFKRFRAIHPETPVIMMSRPLYTYDKDAKATLEVIKNTYNNAIKNGDKNVYLITGRQLMELAKNEGRVDGGHPNDFGFYSMAFAVEKVLKDILQNF